MSGNYFDRLEAELGELARQGKHLDGAVGRHHHRMAALIRRSTVIVVLAVVLAASLVSEFPASASGHGPVVHISVLRGM